MKKIMYLAGAFFAVLLLFVGSLVMMFMMILNDDEEQPETENSTISGTANVPEAVSRWEPLVRKYGAENGLPGSVVPIVLALIMQESGGTAADVMQSSESQSKDPGYFNNPEVSIKFGMQHFANVYRKASGDIPTVLQSYNYGSGFVDWVLPRKYSLDLAKQFSIEQARKNGYTCRAWRSAEEKSKGMCYGDPFYVPHVMRYVNVTKVESGKGGDVAKGSALGDDNFKAIMNEARKYDGDAYVWAGYTPTTGFDCSGLMQWIYKQANINLPRTAQEQYNASTKVSESDAKPGDLVFFTGTYDTSNYITHVGVYLGNGRFYNSNGHGVGESGLDESFWKAHFVGYGRVNK
ncbi:bifunctional lytic transglycosylase/C40 family peptidase [Priestia megaterium]